MLETFHLSKKYGHKTALLDVSLVFDKHITGLLGPNGSGKTTLLRIITGLLEPTAGSLLIDGRRWQPFSGHLTIGYLPQRFGLLKELSVYQHLLYFANLKKIPAARQKKAIEAALAAVNLEERSNARCGSLSGGMVRRVGVAQAILGQPDLLLFDEPTTGLDPEERLRFKTVLGSLAGQCPIILSTHIVEDVESVCDRAVILLEGRVLATDTLEKIIQLAVGRVFEMPPLCQSQLDIPNFVSRHVGNSANEKRVRVLLTGQTGDQWQPPAEWAGLRLCAPTIEDGYLLLIKQAAS